MALHISQKVHRVVKLLRGASHPVVRRVLVQHGFTRADVDKGWDLLKATSTFATQVDPVPANPAIVTALDSFENRWFPIVRFALEANYPAIAEHFFRGLGQASGDLVIVSVTLFVDRLELLEKGAEPFGSDGPAARELLSVRGLIPERVAEAKAYLEELRNVEEPVTLDERAGSKAAEDAVWSWYREWSRIVRHAISDRRWLRRLGLVSRKAHEDEEAPSTPETPEPPEPEAFGSLSVPFVVPGE